MKKPSKTAVAKAWHSILRTYLGLKNHGEVKFGLPTEASKGFLSPKAIRECLRPSLWTLHRIRARHFSLHKGLGSQSNGTCFIYSCSCCVCACGTSWVAQRVAQMQRQNDGSEVALGMMSPCCNNHESSNKNGIPLGRCRSSNDHLAIQQCVTQWSKMTNNCISIPGQNMHFSRFAVLTLMFHFDILHRCHAGMMS